MMTSAPVPAGITSRGPVARLLSQLAKLQRYLYAAIGVVAVWWAVVLIAKPHVSLLPSPFLTARTFVTLVASGELPRHAAYSVFRVLCAWSLATVVAVPLGMQNRRSGKSAGFSTSIGILLAYYVVQSLLRTLAGKGSLPPVLALWLPNVIFLGLGWYLLRMASQERGLRFFLPTGMLRWKQKAI